MTRLLPLLLLLLLGIGGLLVWTGGDLTRLRPVATTSAPEPSPAPSAPPADTAAAPTATPTPAVAPDPAADAAQAAAEAALPTPTPTPAPPGDSASADPLSVEGFDAPAIIAMIDAADVNPAQKPTLKVLVAHADSDPTLRQSVLEQVRALLR